MAAAGYTSLNIDDCWEADERTKDGQLTYNTTKFPSGLKAFGDFVHSLNLSFGLYTSSGPYTCQEYPGSPTHTCRRLSRHTSNSHSSTGAECIVVCVAGSWQHEADDAKQFAAWGVDYLKVSEAALPARDQLCSNALRD